jgi:hypothetical protein
MSDPDDHDLENPSFQDVDDFWNIALEDPKQSTRETENFHDNNNNNDSETSSSCCAETTKQYYIPVSWKKSRDERETETILNLAPLAKADGAWSALGADAWFGSAILSAILLQSLQQFRDDDDNNKAYDNDLLLNLWRNLGSNTGSIFTALELGSGAVGLSGLVMASVLGQVHHSEQQITVLLTDCEDDVLKQLQANVHANEETLAALSTAVMDVQVQVLDWNDAATIMTKNNILSSQLRLVIGSELIYTQDTAHACATLILALLRQQPDLVVLIVQVADRPGFEDIFLPLLSKETTVQLKVKAISFDTFEMATRIMSQSMGGTLDRHEFVSCWIANRNN